MSSDLEQHYSALLSQHGDSARAVQHADQASQEARFRVLSEVSSDLGAVADLGCGLGHFYDYLARRGFLGRYMGMDMLAQFTERARQRHAGNANVSFDTVDISVDDYPDGYDTFVICGVFNNRMPDNESFMYRVLDKAFAAAQRQVAFNAMSTYVDFEAPDLYYSDPREVFDYCKRHLTRRVVLRHDYLVREDRPPYEYTIYLYK